ncbi:Disease resistance protein L6 [Linum perenne]
MVDCWKNGGGRNGQHIILPVFYLIDPRDVRHPDSCSYKEAFEQHSLKHDPETVLEWKNALQEVGKMKGWHITESDGLGAIIDKIFTEVELHLRPNYTLVADELVGTDSHVEDVVKLLNLNSASDNRFIITTRVLELLQECKLFKLEEMSCDHSLKLFSKHAFGVNYPLEDYASLSTEFVRVATGLPLYLKVIGSLLFKRDISFWEDKLIELKQIPPTEVKERLRLSYNDLTHNQKQIFLDIACLFTRVYKEGPMHMWRDCDFCSTSAISTLVQRSLVKIDQNDFYWMHDHVRDLGKAIVREEYNQSPYKCSRISYGRIAIDLLKYKEVLLLYMLICLLFQYVYMFN